MYLGDPYVSAVQIVRDPFPGSWDRSPSWTTSRFQSLEGNFVGWVPPRKPQSRKMSWPWLSESEAKEISRVIRGVEGPGPIACWDGSSDNLMFPEQARGIGDTGYWLSPNAGTILANMTPAPADGQRYRKVTIDDMPVSGELQWRHPTWGAFPICRTGAADRAVYFSWINGGFNLGSGGIVGLQGLDASFNVLETLSSSISGNSGSVSGTFASNSLLTFVRPFVKMGSGTSFSSPAFVGESVLRIGTNASPSSALVEGVGCPAYMVESFSDVTNVWPNRTISASLVEVISVSF